MAVRISATRRRLVSAAVVVASALVFIVGAVLVLDRMGAPGQPAGAASVCATAPGAAGVYVLDAQQAGYATSIAAVGKRLGVADHGVTIALAAALQESNLRNLPTGDRDSVGLFQQRPSQGWGTPEQILDPRFATESFYRHLLKVPNWSTLSVTDAAQAVQRSAAPNAYAQWEGEARALAQAMTGQVAAGFSCQIPQPSQRPRTDEATAALALDLGAPGIAEPVAPARGWTMASWLVGHAHEYRLTSVSFAGQRWTAATARWDPDPTADGSVRI